MKEGTTKQLLAPSKGSHRNSDCKYASTCNLYSNESYTCTHMGGNYCGRYRKLSKKPNADQTEKFLLEISCS